MEGNFRIEKWGIKWRKKKKIIWINSESISECMKLYYEEKLDVIGISPFIGFKLSDLSFLKDYQDVEGIYVTAAEKVDISIIQSLEKLKYLSIGDNQQKFDLTSFSELEYLGVEWHKGIILPAPTDNLTELFLWKYNSKSKNLEEIPDYPNLEELEFNQSPVTTLNGVSKFQKLKTVSFNYLTKLEDISDISSPTLELLDFLACKKIKNHEIVKKLKSLKILRFNDCGEIPSISFIRDLPNLDDFRFVDTNVLDGDLTPCFGLKSVGFLMKKHYSHTPEEVKNVIKANT
jgi:protein phosphatase 1 regulatory subunit 7